MLYPAELRPQDSAHDEEADYPGKPKLEIRLITCPIRAAVGAESPIIFRFSQWKQTDYDAKIVQDPVELKLFLLIMVKAGVDIFHVSTRRFWEPAFEGSNHSLAAWTKQISGKPVIAVGNAGINDPLTMEVFTGSVQSKATSIERVESGLKNDNFDLVAVGRALLADPDWPRKIATDRMSEVIPFSSDSLTS